ncbi:hypothetical protein BC629DRAFT_1260989, partial [Irpex lacteus]
CLRCNQRTKLKDHQFCSDRCAKIAAKSAPMLIRVPKGHIMYNNVKKSFKSKWHSSRKLPTIVSISLITWTTDQRKAFETYRSVVSFVEKVAKRSRPKNKEVKRFRSERRACRLGEKKVVKPCKRQSCWLCKAIRTGFKTSLSGVRFGGGIYMAPSSDKAFEYAKNVDGNKSKLRAVLCVRTVLGKVQKLKKEEHKRMKPNKGYDSVEAKVGNKPTELVVYTADAIRPAYLII